MSCLQASIAFPVYLQIRVFRSQSQGDADAVEEVTAVPPGSIVPLRPLCLDVLG